MSNFKHWLKEQHPEVLDEGWVKKLALGGALLGTGIGVGCSSEQPKDCKLQSSQITSPDAGDFIPNHSSVTSDQAKRKVDIDLGNPDPGVRSQEDLKKIKTFHDKIKDFEARKKRIFKY